MSSPTKLPRWTLAFLCMIVAGIFLWAAVMLPWQEWTFFSFITTALHTAGRIHPLAKQTAA